MKFTQPAISQDLAAEKNSSGGSFSFVCPVGSWTQGSQGSGNASIQGGGELCGRDRSEKHAGNVRKCAENMRKTCGRFSIAEDFHSSRIFSRNLWGEGKKRNRKKPERNMRQDFYMQSIILCEICLQIIGHDRKSRNASCNQGIEKPRQVLPQHTYAEKRWLLGQRGGKMAVNAGKLRNFFLLPSLAKWLVG